MAGLNSSAIRELSSELENLARNNPKQLSKEASVLYKAANVLYEYAGFLDKQPPLRKDTLKSKI